MVEFPRHTLEKPVPGLRYKCLRHGAKQIRLAEFTEEFVEEAWCTRGHRCCVLEGRISVDFEGEVVSYSSGGCCVHRREKKA